MNAAEIDFARIPVIPEDRLAGLWDAPFGGVELILPPISCHRHGVGIAAGDFSV